MAPYESILFSLIIGDCNIIDPAIDIRISPDGHTLFISNISEKAISELVFPTNSDCDNNKLSLIDVNVSLVINPNKFILVPGLRQQMSFAFNNSNSKAYRRRGDVHSPFAEIPAGNFSPEKPTLNAPQLTDVLTGITGFTQSTYGKEKLYMLTLTNGCTNDKGVACVNQQVCPTNGTCPKGSWMESGGCCVPNNG